MWLLLLASFTARYSKDKWIRATGIVLMSMVLVVFTTKQIGIFAQTVKPILLVLNPEWSGPIGNSPHFIFHFLLTVIFVSQSRNSATKILGTAFLLNCGIAVAIESWQAHSFYRATQWVDIMYAMNGTLATLCTVSFTTRFIPHGPDEQQ